MKYILEFNEQEYQYLCGLLVNLSYREAKPIINLVESKVKTEQDENKKPNNPNTDSSDDSMQVLQGEEDANDKA